MPVAFLITTPGASLTDITEVTSHPQPLGQCRRFLERVLPEGWPGGGIEHSHRGRGCCQERRYPSRRDRDHACRRALRWPDHCARHSSIRSNFTRFVVLRNEDSPATGNDKTSISFVLHVNAPGSLLESLTLFAERKIELTKVESRPTKEWLGEYYFCSTFRGIGPTRWWPTRSTGWPRWRLSRSLAHTRASISSRWRMRSWPAPGQECGCCSDDIPVGRPCSRNRLHHGRHRAG